MASVIKLKRSSTAGATPAAGDLEVGEVAINLADRVIYSKQAGGAVVRIGEAALANTNSAIAAVQSALDTQEAKQASDLANTNSSIASQAARIDLVNTNLTATNTAIRTLNTNTQNALDTQEAKQASDLANTNAYIASVQASSGGSLGNTNLAIAQLNTNLLATNTAIRTLNTNTQSALDTQEAKQASDLANTNSYIAATQTNVDTQTARINLLNTNLTATNTAIRTLNTNTQSALDTQEAKQASDLANTNSAIAGVQSALDTQEAKQASNLANTNSYIAATQSNLDTQIAAERAALANTNTRIDGLSTSLSSSYLTVADPASTGHFNHTGRASISTNLSVAGNTHIDGNLTVEGEVTYISTTTLEVMDPLIKLASNNQTDAVDTGFYALYDEGSTAKYAGIFRDATDGIFKVFKDLQADPTVTVDTSGTGYAIGQLDAIVDGGSF
jgi:hypothetical protein